ncbi:DUF5018 domain-containing protein [Larkinella arboricola]
MKTSVSLLFFLALIGLLANCKKEQVDTPKSAKKEFAQLALVGIINAKVSYDSTTFTHTIAVPAGVDVKSLKLAYTISEKAQISPDPTVARDYTNPVRYTVTAEDGTTQVYTVKVEEQIPPKSSEKQIVRFVFTSLNPPVIAAIDESKRTIAATVPAGVNLSALAPTIAVSPQATISPASGIAQDFTKPVNYTVTAEDGSTQVYTVSVEKK